MNIVYRYIVKRAAKRIVRQYIAAACKGDPVACQQVTRASRILNQYNL